MTNHWHIRSGALGSKPSNEVCLRGLDPGSVDTAWQAWRAEHATTAKVAIEVVAYTEYEDETYDNLVTISDAYCRLTPHTPPNGVNDE